MIPISNFYTGQNAGVVIPDTPKIDRSIKNYYDKQFEISKIQLADAQRRQQQLLDYTDVKPIQAIAAKHQADQMFKLAEFEKFAQDMYKEKGGRLFTTDLMMIKNKRNELESWQKNLQANQSLYMQDKATVAGDPVKWDGDYFAEAEQEFFKTGIWNRSLALTRSAGDVTSMFRKMLDNAPTSTGKKVDLIKDESGNVVGQNESYTKKYDFKTNDELKNFYRQEAKANLVLLDSASKQFAKLVVSENPEDVAKAQDYLDRFNTDGDKSKVSDQERHNAILEFAIDNFAPQDVRISTGEVEADKKQSPGINFTWVNGSYTNGKEQPVKQIKTNGVFVNGTDGYWFDPDWKKQPFDISTKTDKGVRTLTFERGVDESSITDKVPVRAHIADDNRVEFVVDNSGAKYARIKKYDVDDTGNRVFYEPKDSLNFPEAELELVTVNGKKGYYHFTQPSQLSAVGDMSVYGEEVSRNYADFLDKLQKQKTKPTVVKPKFSIK